MNQGWVSRIETLVRQLQYRSGAGAVHFSAAALSAATTVAHGLGRTPNVVLVTANDNGAAANISGWVVSNIGPDTFQVTAKTVDGGVIGPGDVQFGWWAR